MAKGDQNLESGCVRNLRPSWTKGDDPLVMDRQDLANQSLLVWICGFDYRSPDATFRLGLPVACQIRANHAST